MKFINQNTKKIIIICFFIVILAVLVFVLKPFFITGEGNQAIVTRYGKIVGTYNECPGQKDCGGNLGHNAGREKAGEQHAGE